MLDRGADDEAAVLACMGLKALGLRELHEQEHAVRALGAVGEDEDEDASASRLQVQRVAVLKAVWSLERLASPAKRAARAAAERAPALAAQPAAAPPQAARKGRPAGRRRGLFGTS